MPSSILTQHYKHKQITLGELVQTKLPRFFLQDEDKEINKDAKKNVHS